MDRAEGRDAHLRTCSNPIVQLVNNMFNPKYPLKGLTPLLRSAADVSGRHLARRVLGRPWRGARLGPFRGPSGESITTLVGAGSARAEAMPSENRWQARSNAATASRYSRRADFALIRAVLDVGAWRGHVARPGTGRGGSFRHPRGRALRWLSGDRLAGWVRSRAAGGLGVGGRCLAGRLQGGDQARLVFLEGLCGGGHGTLSRRATSYSERRAPPRRCCRPL